MFKLIRLQLTLEFEVQTGVYNFFKRYQLIVKSSSRSEVSHETSIVMGVFVPDIPRENHNTQRTHNFPANYRSQQAQYLLQQY